MAKSKSAEPSTIGVGVIPEEMRENMDQFVEAAISKGWGIRTWKQVPPSNRPHRRKQGSPFTPVKMIPKLTIIVK